MNIDLLLAALRSVAADAQFRRLMPDTCWLVESAIAQAEDAEAEFEFYRNS